MSKVCNKTTWRKKPSPPDEPKPAESAAAIPGQVDDRVASRDEREKPTERLLKRGRDPEAKETSERARIRLESAKFG